LQLIFGAPDLEAEQGEPVSAWGSVSPLFFQYRRFHSAELDHKVLCNKKKQTYNAPYKGQQRYISTDCHAVEKNRHVFVFGGLALILERNVVSFFMSLGGMDERAYHKAAQSQDKNGRKTGPCGYKERSIGSVLYRDDLIDKREGQAE
jgi:hypothetical protein